MSLKESFTGLGHHGDHFPDPFIDMGTLAMPDTMRDALEWAEYLAYSSSTYRSAMERVVSYFLTDIQLEDVEDAERKKWEDLLYNTIGIMNILQQRLRNRVFYGNDFASLIYPFQRFLVCPSCGSQYRLSTVYEDREFSFSWSNFEFHASCPSCHYRGAFKVDDKPSDEMDRLHVKLWSPHNMEILHDLLTDETDYIWRIESDYKQQIQRGHLFHLERCSKPVLEAVKNNQLFRFNRGVIHHMKEPSLAGLRNRGWGIPPPLINFRQLWYVQVLHRYNEAIALDYVIPFRLITPAHGQSSQAGGQQMDPLNTINMGGFRNQVTSMIRRRRQDPASWQVLPFPVQYQLLGGEAQQLAPGELIDQGLEQLLNGMNVPVELYKGNLSAQSAPMAARLFESTWYHLIHDANEFLNWLADEISKVMQWPKPTLRLRPPTMADDMQKQMARLQLMMGQQISGQTGLDAMGLDWKQEQKRLAEEQREKAEMQSEMQEEMQEHGMAQQLAKGQPPQEGEQGAPQGGGAPAGGGQGPATQYLASMGENARVTPNQLQQTAESIAQELLGVPNSVRQSELDALNKQHPTLHTLVTNKLEELRGQARLQAGAQVYGV